MGRRDNEKLERQSAIRLSIFSPGVSAYDKAGLAAIISPRGVKDSGSYAAYSERIHCVKIRAVEPHRPNEPIAEMRRSAALALEARAMVSLAGHRHGSRR